MVASNFYQNWVQYTIQNPDFIQMLVFHIILKAFISARMLYIFFIELYTFIWTRLACKYLLSVIQQLPVPHKKEVCKSKSTSRMEEVGPNTITD